MDSTAQWTQDFGVSSKSMAEMSAPPMNACTRSSPASTERKIRPQKDQAVNCPRCNSTNTKFCYYNNYSLTQPRYFCKTCRRYWTEGGTLRNVPVGGGSRKNKKSININSATSSSSSSLSSHKLPDLNPNSQFSSHDHHLQLHQNPKIHDQGHDLNLGFHGPPPEYTHGMIPQFLEFPKIESTANATIAKDHVLNMSSTTSSSNPISALNFLRANGARGLNSFIPVAPNALENNALFASSGINFPFQECKPSLGFSIDGASRFANPNGVTQDSGVNGSLMFTLGGTKRSDQDDQNDQGNKGQENSNGFWNGMLGGGNW